MTRVRRLAFAAAFSCFALIAAVTATAAELEVLPPASDCVASPMASRYCDLGAAVAAAREHPGPDVIRLAPGATYVLTVVDHQNEGGNGLPAIVDELTVEGQGAALERSWEPGTPVFRLFRVAKGGALTLRRLTLRNGATPPGFDGAAIWNVGRLTVEACTFEDNHSGDDGGAIRNDGVLRLADSLLRNNSARWRGGVGGGIQNAEQYGEARATIERTSFIDNEAWANGGALWMEGSVTIESSTLSGNRAGKRGGAIENYGTLTLASSTITDNQAGVDSGGLHTFGPVSLANTILSGNRAMISEDCEGKLVSLGHNLLGKGYRCTVTGDSSGNLEAVNPNLGRLAEIDGAHVHPPRPGSPVIDAGNPAAPGSTDAACAATDQRRRPRAAASGRCDIGAVEAD